MIVYKIRSKDGRFSSGGVSACFGKKGKIWKQWNHVSNHLGQLDQSAIKRYDDEDAEVVEYEMTERGKCKAMTVIAAGLQRKAERDRQLREFWAMEREKQRRLEYERLKKEFES